MASTQSFSASASVSRQATNYGYTDFDLSLTFPNETAKPIKADFFVHVHRDYYFLLSPTATAHIEYNGVNKCSVSSSREAGADKTETGDTAAEITGHGKSDTSVRIGTVSSYSGCTARAEGTITLYFIRYDFSASVGTGISSVAVSSANGYDGDTVTFTASVQSGYAFDGWYNGSTKVSSSLTYQHTVNGADLSLTAKAVVSARTVTIKYDGTTIATWTTSGNVGIMYDDHIYFVPAGQTRTLVCGGKVMRGDVLVGNKTLQCDGKVMSGDISVSVS